MSAAPAFRILGLPHFGYADDDFSRFSDIRTTTQHMNAYSAVDRFTSILSRDSSRRGTVTFVDRVTLHVAIADVCFDSAWLDR